MTLKFAHTLEDEDQRHFDHACGYQLLGMHEDALKEIQLMNSSTDEELPVMLLKGEILNSLGRYAESILVLAPAIPRAPRHPEFVIQLAYATRRAQSIEKAQAMLEQATVIFPRNALIHYNLACYCAQMGNEARALEKLAVALKLDPSLADLAVEDTDFQPLHRHPAFENLISPVEKKGK